MLLPRFPSRLVRRLPSYLHIPRLPPFDPVNLYRLRDAIFLKGLQLPARLGCEFESIGLRCIGISNA